MVTAVVLLTSVSLNLSKLFKFSGLGFVISNVRGLDVVFLPSLTKMW